MCELTTRKKLYKLVPTSISSFQFFNFPMQACQHQLMLVLQESDVLLEPDLLGRLGRLVFILLDFLMFRDNYVATYGTGFGFVNLKIRKLKIVCKSPEGSTFSIFSPFLIGSNIFYCVN